MALAPKGKITFKYPGQDKLYFLDNTGLYNVTTNSAGYGTPNIAKADVVQTDLLLRSPSDDEDVLLTSWTYLPTDAAAATIICDQYAPDETDEEDTNECDDCPDDTLLTDCDEETVTCFVDGCWKFTYKVYTVGPVLHATVVFNQFLYGQTLKRLHDLTKAIKSGMVNSWPNWNWEEMLTDAWIDYDSMLIVSQLSDCDCVCIENSLASLQRKLIEMENKV